MEPPRCGWWASRWEVPVLKSDRLNALNASMPSRNASSPILCSEVRASIDGHLIEDQPV
jgi:hypothetical protein